MPMVHFILFSPWKTSQIYLDLLRTPAFPLFPVQYDGVIGSLAPSLGLRFQCNIYSSPPILAKITHVPESSNRLNLNCFV